MSLEYWLSKGEQLDPTFCNAPSPVPALPTPRHPSHLEQGCTGQWGVAWGPPPPAGARLGPHHLRGDQKLAQTLVLVWVKPHLPPKPHPSEMLSGLVCWARGLPAALRRGVYPRGQTSGQLPVTRLWPSDTECPHVLPGSCTESGEAALLVGALHTGQPTTVTPCPAGSPAHCKGQSSERDALGGGGPGTVTTAEPLGVLDSEKAG